jgi:hypothetical protein
MHEQADHQRAQPAGTVFAPAAERAQGQAVAWVVAHVEEREERVGGLVAVAAVVKGADQHAIALL